LSENWIISSLKWAYDIWNGRLTEIWALVTQSPQNFKGGTIWNAIVTINGALQSIGYGLLILFFAMSVFKSTANLEELRRPEQALKLFIRFVAAKTAITYGMDIMALIFEICAGVADAAGGMGAMSAAVTLPADIEDAINSLGFLASVPLWILAILGSVMIVVLSLYMLLTVYGRFFRLYLYTAISPVAFSTFGGDVASNTGKSFIKGYIGVCMEGAVIIISLIIYSAFASSGATTLGGGGTVPFTMTFAYLAETIFSMLILVGLVKGSDRIVKEMISG
jgi:hypothetical protein